MGQSRCVALLEAHGFAVDADGRILADKAAAGVAGGLRARHPRSTAAVTVTTPGGWVGARMLGKLRERTSDRGAAVRPVAKELPLSDYAPWFETATGQPPYGWQVALADGDRCDDRLVRVPTGRARRVAVPPRRARRPPTSDPRAPRI
jgi:hypothetical protein